MKNIAVIGGGITGVTTAYALAHRGLTVTLIERHRYAAMETSFANGGQLSASNAEVWTHTSTLWKGLKWMLKANAPLLVNPRPDWHKLSWFVQFIGSIPKYESNTIETARLAIAARQHLFAWAEAEHIDFDLKREGILHIYRDKGSFDHARKVSALLAQGGLSRQAVTPEEMRSIEPSLAGTYYGGFFTESDSTGDIHKFTTGLAAAAAKLGVNCLYEQDVSAIKLHKGRVQIITAIEGQPSDAMFDAVVICAGVASRRFAADAVVMVSGHPPIKAKKLRYYQDRNFTTRVLPAPVLVAGAYADRPATRPDDWSGLPPLAALSTSSGGDAGGFADEGGHPLKPELDLTADTSSVPDGEGLLVLDDEDDVPLRPQDVDRQLMRTARLAALEPDDGIAL